MLQARGNEEDDCTKGNFELTSLGHRCVELGKREELGDSQEMQSQALRDCEYLGIRCQVGWELHFGFHNLYTPLDGVNEINTRIGAEKLRQGHVTAQKYLLHCLFAVAGAEGRRPSEHVVEQSAQTPPVDRAAMALAAQHLGCPIVSPKVQCFGRGGLTCTRWCHRRCA